MGVYLGVCPSKFATQRFLLCLSVEHSPMIPPCVGVYLLRLSIEVSQPAAASTLSQWWRASARAHHTQQYVGSYTRTQNHYYHVHPSPSPSPTKPSNHHHYYNTITTSNRLRRRRPIVPRPSYSRPPSPTEIMKILSVASLLVLATSASAFVPSVAPLRTWCVVVVVVE